MIPGSTDAYTIGQVLRRAFGGPPARFELAAAAVPDGEAPDLDTLARIADAALARHAAAARSREAVAALGRMLTREPGLHPLMRATLAGLYGEEPVAKLDAAPPVATPQEPHGAGDELIYEYDPAEQARFEEECARDLAGDLD